VVAAFPGGHLSDLSISLFGKFNVCYANHNLASLQAAKVQELFCYLLLFRDKPHPRESLADVLWSDSSQSRKYLRKALWQLQTAFDSETRLNSGDILLVDPNWIQLNAEAVIYLDAKVLEQSFLQVQGVPGNQLDAQSAEVLQEVIGLYQGDLLEACYAGWCLLERERYRYMYLAILDKLMAFYEANQAYDDGIRCGNLALRHDLARERTHRRLMCLFYLKGYRTEALRQYGRCVKALEEELGVEPTEETRELYEQIRAGVRISRPRQHVADYSSPASLSIVLSQIQQAQIILADAQRQIQKDIGAQDMDRL